MMYWGKKTLRPRFFCNFFLLGMGSTYEVFFGSSVIFSLWEKKNLVRLNCLFFHYYMLYMDDGFEWIIVPHPKWKKCCRKDTRKTHPWVIKPNKFPPNYVPPNVPLGSVRNEWEYKWVLNWNYCVREKNKI
jgi:hypothetical protein